MFVGTILLAQSGTYTCYQPTLNNTGRTGELIRERERETAWKRIRRDFAKRRWFGAGKQARTAMMAHQTINRVRTTS